MSVTPDYSVRERLRDGREFEIRALRPEDRADMLAAIGVDSIDAVFADVPEAARLNGPVVIVPISSNPRSAWNWATDTALGIGTVSADPSEASNTSTLGRVKT